MSTSVVTKVNLKNLERVTNNIEHLTNALYKVSEELLTEIVSNWSNAKGGNNTNLKPLSKDYETAKRNKTGRDKRDLLLSGDLYRSFHVKKEDKTTMALTFTPDAMTKAKSNYKKDENMMKVNKALAKKLVKDLNKYIY